MIFFFILSLFSSLAWADPMPHGLIVKDGTCSYFWAGDDCHRYTHESGWQEIYATKGIFHSSSKTCSLAVSNGLQAEACCKHLGLRYVRVRLEKDKNFVPAESCKKNNKR